jgi:uncharacterized protein
MRKVAAGALAAGLITSCLSVITPHEAIAQASFDCRRASTPTEIAVCRSPDLAWLDQQMDGTFRAVLANSENPDALRQSQRQWLSDVQLCGADEGCIEKTYSDRILELSPNPDEDPAEVTTEESPTVLHSEAASPDQATTAQRLAPISQPMENAVGETNSSSPAKRDDETALLGGAMILALIVAGLVALGATKALANYSIKRFGWPMILNWWNVLHLVSIFAFLGAFSVGAPMAGIVVAGGLWLIVLFVNVRKTNLLAGLAMTILQPFLVFIMWAIYGVLKAKAEGRRI